MSEQSSWFKKSAGKSYPSVAFEQIGAVVVGHIIDEPRIVLTKDDDGNEVENLLVNVTASQGTNIRAGKAAERQAVTVGDQVSVWLKPGQIARAVAEALTTAKADGLAEGGTLAIQYYADGERKPGKSAPKLYNAEYKAPVVTVGLGAGLLAGAGTARDDNAPF
jgi:hypothetical protein